MTPLSKIMHQVAKTILHRNFFYIHILKVTKTTNNAFLMTLLSRIIHQVAKIIIYWNFFKIRTLILQKQILLHFQWPLCLGSCARLLKQYSTGTFFIFVYYVTRPDDDLLPPGLAIHICRGWWHPPPRFSCLYT